MAVVRDLVTPTKVIDIEAGISAYRSAITNNIGAAFGVASSTGIIAAALTANSTIFFLRLSAAAPVIVVIEKLRIEFVTIVPFTVPITAGRRLSIIRAGGLITATSGGNALAGAGQIVPKNYKDGSNGSWCTNNNAGDIRLASTGALTITGILTETTSFGDMNLTGFGTAGAYREFEYLISDKYVSPMILLPGQLLAIRNPVAMDAAGTWQAAISVDWREIPIF
jgi:hypothetical protein